MEAPRIFAYNVLMRTFSDGPDPKEIIFLYKRLKQMGSNGDSYTYPLLFKVCSRLSLTQLGRQILVHALQLGFDADLFVYNAIIHMVASWGELDLARQVFELKFDRDLVSWNSMINGYVQGGRFCEALDLFHRMRVEGMKPDDVTMIGVVSCCAQSKTLNLGMKIHQSIEESGLNCTLHLYNALMDMYIKCGCLVSAKKLFDEMPRRSVVSWTTLIVGYLSAGKLDVARKLFDEMPDRDVITWNAMMTGYVQYRQSKEVLTLFNDMQHSNVKPNEGTIVCLLSSCAQLGALDIGLWAHHYLDAHRLQKTVEVGTALVDMYAKCGNIDKSLRVFKDMLQKNSHTWTALIGGLALHGHGQDALSYFRKMINVGLEPDEITFIEVLSACCHAGLVQEGRTLFLEMSTQFKISPKLKHYSCMVDLLGRAGLLDEAAELIRSMPVQPDAVIWGTLFFASANHKNIQMGEWAASRLLELDPDDSATYVLLSNMYVEANMWDQAWKIRRLMRKKGMEKDPACSLIEVDGIVSEFLVRDNAHPQKDEIYKCLIQLSRQS